MTKRIVLCADDYGQALAISQGILQLIQQKRLSATGCMVNTIAWPECAQWLVPFYQQVDIGLHFNLTHGTALSSGAAFPSLSQLLRQSFLRQLNQAAIEAECHAQIDQFQAATGFLPDFIDGHQHVHQFPVIRDAVIAVHQQRLPKAYMRYVYEPLNGNFKKMMIRATGTKALERLLIKHNIPHNQSFAGIYDFKQADQYSTFFPDFLRNIQEGGLIMCHPGFTSSTEKDEIAKARIAEYQYLSSDKFLADCERYHVEISRYF